MKLKMKKQDKKRNTYIDIIKGLLIIFVILGHSIQWGSGQNYIDNALFFNNILFKFIYSFHMPLFIMISGYLSYNSLNKKSLKETIISKIKTLIIPLLLWSIIPFIINNTNFFNIKESIKLFITTFSTNLWFLWSLFYINILIKIINKYFKDNIYIISILITFILPNTLVIKYFNINFYLYSFMYFYFLIGYFYKKYNLQEKLVNYFNYKILIINTILFIIMLFFFKNEHYIYTSLLNILNNYKQIFIDIYRYLIGIIGCIEILLFIYIIKNKINKKIQNILIYIGKNTLGIYIISSIIQPYLLPLITNKLNTINYLLMILETIIVLIVSVLITELIKKNKYLNKYLLGEK